MESRREYLFLYWAMVYFASNVQYVYYNLQKCETGHFIVSRELSNNFNVCYPYLSRAVIEYERKQYL
jgi:hypothetical protein